MEKIAKKTIATELLGVILFCSLTLTTAASEPPPSEPPPQAPAPEAPPVDPAVPPEAIEIKPLGETPTSDLRADATPRDIKIFPCF